MNTGSGTAGKRVLGERDDGVRLPVAIEVGGERGETAKHAGVDRHEQRLDQRGGEVTDLGGEQVDEHLAHDRITEATCSKMLGVDHLGDRCVEGDRCAVAADHPGLQRQQPEHLARTQHPVGDRVSVFSERPRGDVALFDQMHRVGPIPFMEDHLTATKRPPARHPEQLVTVALGQPASERPNGHKLINRPVFRTSNRGAPFSSSDGQGRAIAQAAATIARGPGAPGARLRVDEWAA